LVTHVPDDGANPRSTPELTALADGSLVGWRRARLEAELTRSPELRAELHSQRRAVEAIRSVDFAAPAALRARVETERPL
jgi:anti-sigma factor RsiW